MATRDGRKYVYCTNCKYFYYGDECWNPNNIDRNHWEHPIPASIPRNINKTNDCKWHQKPKWHAKFGWK